MNRKFKLFYLILTSIITCFPLLLTGQTTTSYPWDSNPKAYVTNLATEASKQQVLVQEKIKKTESTIQELKLKLDATKIPSSQFQINKDLSVAKDDLSSLKSLLKEKIKISQSYKSLLSKTPAQIKSYLLKEYAVLEKGKETSPIVVTSKSIKTDTIIPISEVKKSAPVVMVQSSPTLNSSTYKFESWTDQVTAHPGCQFQTYSDPSKYKGVEPELLFAYTPEEIKKALRGISYSKGYAFVGKEPGYTFLQLNIEIASDLALQHYGNLNKSFMIIKLINGKEVRLINSRFDSGKVDIKKKTTTMSGMYYIDKNDEKALSTSELDTIKFQYASGYEDYIIYNVDFFTRQLACINSLK